jgi:hypothetical protein
MASGMREYLSSREAVSTVLMTAVLMPAQHTVCQQAALWPDSTVLMPVLTVCTCFHTAQAGAPVQRLAACSSAD